MILLPATEITEGMSVAREIRGKENKLLLARGTMLTSSGVRLLQFLGIAAVYIEQEGTEDICAEDVIPPELRAQCQRVIGQALSSFQKQASSKNVTLDTRAVEDATFGMVEQLFASRNLLMAVMDVKDWDNRFFQHAVNTAVIATILAREMGHSEEACKQLAMGMIFHDSGQMFLPREIFEKQGGLSEEERHIVHQHTRLGFEHTMRSGILSSLSAYVVLRHHERIDGTGYPDGIPGEQLHPLARIAAVAEAFDAMTSIKTYGRAMMPDQAMRKILTQAGTAFDKEVALTLVRHVAIYPTGSAVRLNTGERGIVVSTSPGDTTRPVVRLLFCPEGKRMSMTNIDLSKERDRLIVQSGLSLDQVKATSRRPHHSELRKAA